MFAERADKICRELFPFVCTTVAPNVLEGSSTAANVMPADVSCTVNFRLLPGVTAEGVVRLGRAERSAAPFEG